MRKVVAGVLVAIVLGAAALYVGLPRWAQFRAEREVDAAFAAARAAGGSASHGAVRFDLASRSLTIADIAFKSPGDRSGTLQIGRLVATGIDEPEAGRFTAKHIDLIDFNMTTPPLAPGGLQASYGAPAIAIESYSGPTAPPRKTDASGPVAALRQALQYFAAIDAQSITAPSLAARVTPAAGAALGPVEYVYSGVALRDIHAGRIAAASVERASFTFSNAPNMGKAVGELGKSSVADIDVGPVLAALDPQGAPDDSYRRAYRQAAVGPLTLKLDGGGEIRLGGMTLDELALRPSKLKLADLLTMADLILPAGQQASPAQAHALTDRVAAIYEGMRIGRFEVDNVSANMGPDATFNLAAIRVTNLENGKLGEIALEGLDGRAPGSEPVRVGRFALEGLDIANLMRNAALFSPGQQPSTDQLVGMLAFVSGVQLNDVVAPTKETPRPIRISEFAMSWGQFVGPIPTQAKLAAKVALPIDATDHDPWLSELAKAGLSAASANVDFGLNWREADQTFVVTPAMVELGGACTASLKWSINKVSRDIFTTDPIKIAIASSALEAGQLEFSLHDTGGVDLMIGEMAKSQGVAPEAARTQFIAFIEAEASALAQGNSDIQPATEAVVQFLSSRGATLAITVAPRARVNLMQAIELARTDPSALLPQLKIDAKVSR